MIAVVFLPVIGQMPEGEAHGAGGEVVLVVEEDGDALHFIGLGVSDF